MAFKIRVAVAALLTLGGVPPAASAQQALDLAAGGADLLFRGSEAGARAGLWLDNGALNDGDNRRDLVVGAPGDGSTVGNVYILFGGPTRSGEFPLSRSEAMISGGGPGDLFGTSTGIGNVLNAEGSAVRAIAVGAPNAHGGRGAVYLFRAGFTVGAALTTANAVLTIIGNTGDNLGTMLATADLNNDTYREIVIGAPGTGRIYVINGGPSLGGTIDLSTTPASSVITGSGIGEVMAAADVTGDGVSDLLIGVPSFSNLRGVVYLVAGRASGGFPSSLAVVGGANATFVGIDANDLAGSTIRIGDLDADGLRDIVIGAPGGDGPSGTRTDAGEVYVLWGGAGIPASLSLANAPVTFFGAQPSDRLGAFVTSGDINRDSPDDLVLRAGGGAGSVGQLAVYYGRSRRTIGTALPDGRRQVDIGAPGQVDRVIRGDTSAGPLSAASVYELTGEGARDVVVSAPFAATASGPLSGYVYFTISPKLRINPASIEMGAAQNASTTASFEVGNSSRIEITWTAFSDRSWTVASPSSGTAASEAPATVTVDASAAGLAPGSYSSRVVVTSTSRDLDMFRPVTVTFNVLSPPTLRADKAFPAQAASPITFTANATGGTGSLRYKFYRYRYSTGAWAMVQDYSASNTFTWTPSISEVDDYVLQVWVRDATSAAAWQAFAGTDRFTIARPVPRMGALSANVAFPAAPGTPVTFTAQATGGLAPLQYKFWRLKSGSGWTMARDWATDNTYTWTPSAADQGTYTLQAWVRNSGGTDLDDWRAVEFSIQSTTPVFQALTANRTFPAGTGTPITWTARVSGGSAGPLQYKFWRYSSATGAWTVVQDYSSANTYTWNPGYGDVGSYVIQVWARSSGSSASHETWTSFGPFSIVRLDPSITSFTANAAFPANSGTPITWTAQAAGGGGTLEYQFWRYNAATSSWALVRPYATLNTYTWTPSAAETGTYTLQVWVRTAGTTASLETWASSGFFTIQ